MNSRLCHAVGREPDGQGQFSLFGAFNNLSLHRNTRIAIWPLVWLLAALVTGMSVASAAPDAGTMIGNQGSIDFVDAEGNPRSVTSNLVEVEVLQVYALDLATDTERQVANGNSVTFPHSLTNTGNGPDSFDLLVANLAGDDFDFSTILIYVDDGSGNPTGDPITSTPTLAPGDTFQFVVVADVPATAADGEQGQLSVTATSSDGATTASNTDTAVVTADAVVLFSKTMTPGNGPADGNTEITVTLRLENVGLNAASDLQLSDVLQSGFVYQAGSGAWSESATGLDDGRPDSAGGDPAGIDYGYDAGSATVSATIDTLAAGASQTVEFKLVIANGTLAGRLQNTAALSYDDGSGETVSTDSNTTIYEVDQTAAPVANDSSPDGSVTSGTDEDGDADNGVVQVNTAAQGDTVRFDNIITNAGNGPDTFNMTLANSTFPAATGLALYKPDGVTPLVDTDGDGIADTGELQPGESYVVVLQVSLPPSLAGDNGGAGWQVEKTATSAFDGSSSTVVDRVASIESAAVDLTLDVTINNGAGAGDGAGTGPEGNAVRSNTTDSDSITTFNVHVNNVGASADNYSLDTPELPAGWGVAYYLDGGTLGVRDAGDVLITDGKTGRIEAGDSTLIFADVSVPVDAVPADYRVDMAVASASSGSADQIRAQVSVNEVHQADFVADESGTVFPGGSVSYPHSLTNNSNLPETFTFEATDSTPGWDTQLFVDTNGNGVLDADDVLINSGDTFELQPGEVLNIIAQLSPPDGADAGASNDTTIVATFNDGQTVSVTDNTTVSSGDVDGLKEQALDANCDGTVEGGYGIELVQANPGECIAYRISATNPGSVTVTNVRINDATPAFTRYETCGGACAVSGSGTLSAPPQGGEGSVRDEIPSLAPGQTEVLGFTVRINP